MSFRNTIILAVLVALFGAYLFYVERPAIEREEQESKLLDVQVDQVTGVSVESSKGKVDLVKSGDAWKITAPRETGADPVTVDSLLDSLEDAKIVKSIEETPSDLAPFGLDQPESTVVLKLADGGERKFAFGKKAPIGGSAYARRGDEQKILLVPDGVRMTSQKGLDDLRDRTVLTFADADVTEIKIQTGESEPIVLRKDGNDWTMVSPTTVKADASQVRSLLASLRALRATAFVDDAGSPPDAKYNLTPPRVTVELTVGPSGEKKTLLVGGATDEPAKKEIYAQAAPGDTVYVVGSHLYSTVTKTPLDFRDKTVHAFDKDKVQRVVVTRQDGAGFTLEKKDGKWSVADAGDTPVKEFIASRYVDDLRELKGTDIASEEGPRPEFQLSEPTIRVELEGADGKLGAIAVSVQGEGADKRIYAAADGSQTVYLLQDYVFQRVDKQRNDFLTLPTPTPAASPAATSGDAADGEGEDPASDDEPAE